MNIALEKTEEWVNGQKRRTYGDAFVRGNNGTYHPPSLSLLPPSLASPTDKRALPRSHVHLRRIVEPYERRVRGICPAPAAHRGGAQLREIGGGGRHQQRRLWSW